VVGLLSSAARRFLLLVVVVGGATALVSYALGAAIGSSAARSVSLGLYLVGSLILVGGVLIGSRGPLRLRDAASGTPFWGSRAVRWATEAEREEALNTSAVFVGVGLVLVALGVVADNRFSLV
jgi:hypothetical protein